MKTNNSIEAWELQLTEEFERENREIMRHYPDNREINPFLEKEDFLFNLQCVDDIKSPALLAAIKSINEHYKPE